MKFKFSILKYILKFVIRMITNFKNIILKNGKSSKNINNDKSKIKLQNNIKTTNTIFMTDEEYNKTNTINITDVSNVINITDDNADIDDRRSYAEVIDIETLTDIYTDGEQTDESDNESIDDDPYLNINYKYVMYRLILKNDVKELKSLLDHYPTTKKINKYTKCTYLDFALDMAVINNNINIVKLLISYGADVTNIPYILDIPIRDNNIEMVRLLLYYGGYLHLNKLTNCSIKYTKNNTNIGMQTLLNEYTD